MALVSAAIITSSAQAQQPVRLSLDECISYALKNNYTVKNAHIDALISEAQVKQTTSAAMPHVNGKADFSYANIVPAQFIDASTFPTPGVVVPKGTIIPISFALPYSASANITASQLLFDGSVIVALQAKNTVVELARQREHVTQESLRHSIYKSYNALVIAHRQFDLIKTSLVLARSMEQDLIKTREAGFAEKIDVERTSVQINNLATDSMKVANMLTVAEQVLKYNMGMEINTPIVLIDTNVERRNETSLELLGEKESYERIPDYNVLLTALKLNEFDLKRHRLSALPSISGFWSYGQNYGSDKFRNMFNFDWYAPSSILGIAINAPIFNGFMRQNQVREAKLNIEKTRNNIDYLKQSLDFQAATARTTLKNSMLQVQSQKRNLELSNSVLDLAQRKYKEGVGSNLEVTNAQTELLRSQNNYFSALLEVANAEADLRKALGLLK